MIWIYSLPERSNFGKLLIACCPCKPDIVDFLMGECNKPFGSPYISVTWQMAHFGMVISTCTCWISLYVYILLFIDNKLASRPLNAS